MKRNRIGSILSSGIIILAIILVCIGILTGCTTGIVENVNNYEYGLKKANDRTDYKTLKNVEDTCRSLISSYESDKFVYEQYRDVDNEEKQSWAEQAKMRANKTASTYNNYIKKNSFIWEDAVPEDIKQELEYIE